jgi:hypothetical protein
VCSVGPDHVAAADLIGPGRADDLNGDGMGVQGQPGQLVAPPDLDTQIGSAVG